MTVYQIYFIRKQDIHMLKYSITLTTTIKHCSVLLYETKSAPILSLKFWCTPGVVQLARTKTTLMKTVMREHKCLTNPVSPQEQCNSWLQILSQ